MENSNNAFVRHRRSELSSVSLRQATSYIITTYHNLNSTLSAFKTLINTSSCDAWTQQVEDFWVVTPCGIVVGYQAWRQQGPPKRRHHTTTLHSEDEGSKFLRNAGILPQHYTLKMKAASSSETSVSYNTTHWRRRRQVPPKRPYPTTLRTEDGGSRVLRNVSNLPQHCTLKIEAARSSETSVYYHNTTH
jgi:hypothetical protein